jgi:hypothetical protein
VTTSSFLPVLYLALSATKMTWTVGALFEGWSVAPRATSFSRIIGTVIETRNSVISGGVYHYLLFFEFLYLLPPEKRSLHYALKVDRLRFIYINSFRCEKRDEANSSRFPHKTCKCRHKVSPDVIG